MSPAKVVAFHTEIVLIFNAKAGKFRQQKATEKVTN